MSDETFVLPGSSAIFIVHLWPCDLEKEKCEPATFDFNFERTIDIDGPPQLKTSTNSQNYFYEIDTIHENIYAVLLLFNF